MNFSQLIKTLVDYIDLGKRLATTIPGMVLAFGFVLLFAQAPDVFRQNRIRQELNQKLTDLAQLREEKIPLEQAQEQERDRFAMADEMLAGFNQQRQAALSDYKQKPSDETRAALRAAQTAYGTAWEKEKKAPGNAFRKADDALSAHNARIAAADAEVQGLRKALTDASGFAAGLTSLFDAVILFGLVGFALGLVLDPLNKAIFLQFIPGIGEKRGERVKSITGYHLKQKPRTKYAEFEVHYYIGRGLITQTEYDDLVASYYRLSEISLGMIVPVLVLAAGFIKVQAAKGGGSFLLYASITLAALLGAWVLFRVGVKRYGEFQTRVYRLIEGRDAAFEEQLKQSKREAIAVQQAAVIRELKDLVTKLKAHAGAPHDS